MFRSLWYHRWISLAVMLGVVCASAVLTGALLVGDSMRGSLRSLTLDRLGKIDVALQSTGFFEPPTFSDLPQPWQHTRPAILLPAAVEANENIVAIELLGQAPPHPNPSVTVLPEGEGNSFGVVLNAIAAEKLRVNEGDTVSLRLNSPQSIPPDSSLGRRDDLIIRARLPIHKIIPNEGLGRFSLKSDQQAQPLGIVPLDWLQNRLDVPGKVNTVFFETASPETVSTPEQLAELEKLFNPSFDDLGIAVTEKDGKTYITSQRMMFTENQAAEIQRVFPNAEPGLLYLATSIKAVKNGREVPYSTVFATNQVFNVEDIKPVPLDEPEEHIDYATPGPPVFSPIALNQWAADDLQVEIGDEIELTWFEPDDATKTRSQKFVLQKILPMDGIGADANLVPAVKGFTDEAAIADWNPPFPFDAKKIRKIDEDYWDKHRAAPKAFVPRFIGQTLWGSRFGNVTTFLVESGEWRVESDKLSPAVFGLHFVPLKAQGLAASAGTTPFSMLFLSFSFFIIAAALMLVLMLFRLSIEMKAKQIGIRLAVGWTPRQVARLLLAEGFVIAATGSLLGVVFGIFYAQVMVYGLTTWWVDAVTTPFLKFYVTPLSLCSGFLGGVVLALITILWSLRNVGKVPVKTLLGGDFDVAKKIPLSHWERAGVRGDSTPHDSDTLHLNPLPEGEGNDYSSSQRGNDEQKIFGLGPIAVQFTTLFCASGTMMIPIVMGAGNNIGFFIAGFLVLLYGLGIISILFNRYKTGQTSLNSLYSLGHFNIVRKPGRSLLFVGLVASTTFLVLTISAFRLEPGTSGPGARGDGGFAFIAETAFPVYENLETETGLENLGIQDEQKKFLSENPVDIVSFRVHGGDNAGCLNLYRSQSPRVLGVPWWKMEARAPQKQFSFAKPKQRYHESPTQWAALNGSMSIDPDGVPRVPVILDANTAMYALHLYGGIGEVFERIDLDGSVLRCEVVGLLSNSIFQGDILIGEANFVKLFPEDGGYRYFLFDITPPHPLYSGNTTLPGGEGNDYNSLVTANHAIKIFYAFLGDYGFTGEPTADRLRKLFAVQNTYLSTFQSLGGVGLLLGIFGLAVIQLRNIFERRKELALMQALGFAQSRIMLLLLYESFSLLTKGLGLALVASLFALAPFLFGWANQEASSAAIFAQLLWLVGGMIAVAFVSNIFTAGGVLKIPVARELAEER